MLYEIEIISVLAARISWVYNLPAEKLGYRPFAISDKLGEYR